MAPRGNKDIKKLSKTKEGLQPKQDIFCREYVIDFNATRAALKAGYSPQTAFATGHKNLKNGKILERIEFYKKNIAEALQITAVTIASEHAKIAFSDTTKIKKGWITQEDFDAMPPETKSAIKSIETRIDPATGEKFVRVNLWDKQKALDSLAAMTGFNAPIKMEHTGANGKDLFKGMSDEELRERIKKLSKQLGE